VIGQMQRFSAELGEQAGADFAAMKRRLDAGIAALTRSATWLIETFPNDIKAAHAGSVPFLKLTGIVTGGWQLFRAALVAQAHIENGDADPFYAAKVVTARFYADHILAQADGLAEAIVDGAAGVMGLPEEMF
jgi:hypothetical protein